jgi:two-component system OmpR family sensor kinase
MNFLFHSVRWRLQLWHALILLGLIAAVCMLAYRLAADERRDRIDRELEAFERAFIRRVWEMPSDKPKDGLPPSTEEVRQRFLGLDDASKFPLELRELFDPAAVDRPYLAYWDGEGKELFRSANAPESLKLPDYPPPDVSQQPRTRGHFRELVRAGPRGFRSLSGRDVTPDRTALSRLALQIGAGGAALWFLGLLGGWFLAGRVIRPIDAISRTASRIAAGNLSERIDIAGADNELSRLSEVLNETFDRLAASIERQREFTADASHELRTPLTVVLSEVSRGLKRERTPGEYREILQNCNHAAGRMRSLVEALLVLARQDGDPKGTPREKTDLSETAADVFEMLKPLAAQRGIQLESKLDPAICLADPQALSMAVGNLLSNAIRHQPSGGTASVRVFSNKGRAILEVADTGPGIGPEHLPRLFDRFYRVDPARGTEGGHAGLGLAIAKAIVENHHGTIEVESSVGKGSVFRLNLPLADLSLRA